MRGRDIRGHSFAMVAGITPAYAGKSTRLSRIQHCAEGSPPRMRGRVPTPRPRLIKSQDHPRVCGEEHHPTPSSAAPRGSPPRMRGRVPAQRSGCCLQWDHPRVCGEESGLLLRPVLWQGSPPRMRGRDAANGFCAQFYGITPAYAGKRLKKSHSIGHFSCILCLFHSVLHRASASGGSRAGPCAPPCLPAQNAVPV